MSRRIRGSVVRVGRLVAATTTDTVQMTRTASSRLNAEGSSGLHYSLIRRAIDKCEADGDDVERVILAIQGINAQNDSEAEETDADSRVKAKPGGLGLVRRIVSRLTKQHPPDPGS